MTLKLVIEQNEIPLLDYEDNGQILEYLENDAHKDVKVYLYFNTFKLDITEVMQEELVYRLDKYCEELDDYYKTSDFVKDSELWYIFKEDFEREQREIKEHNEAFKYYGKL